MSQNASPRGMSLRQPAVRWEDACPTGNGSIGAMLYGNVCQEHVLLNHEALRRRRPRPPLADVSDLLPRVRELIADGQCAAAARLMPEAMAERGGAGERPDPYLPFGVLRFTHETTAPFAGYRRGVDFESGEAWCRWREAGAAFDRRVLVSRSDDVVVLHQSADRPAARNGALGFASRDGFGQMSRQFATANAVATLGGSGFEDGDLPVRLEAGAAGEMFWMSAVTDTGVPYGAVGRVVAHGGSVAAGEGVVSVADADALTVLVALYHDESAEAALPRLRERLAALSGGYEALLAPHREAHRALFRRCTLHLDDADAPAEVPNEDLLARAYDGDVPPALIQRMHDLGRFLLIGSSRPGGLPANLQGVWNGDYAPAWAADYHNDENVQMCYWLAGPAQLSDLARPVFDYFESFVDDYRENARKLYGCRGIYVPIVQATHGRMHGLHWVSWTAAAGWLGEHFFDHYRFTGDRAFLAERCVPWLQECLAFYEDFLVEDENGALAFVPSLSPENIPAGAESMVAADATMDVAVCREVLSNLRAACDELGERPEIRARCDALLEHLPAYAVNEHGALREWLDPRFPDNDHHRHQSHLYPFFPGCELTPEETPALVAACREAVERRLTIGLRSQTSWSLIHMAHVFARLGEGARANECLELVTRAEAGPNLLTYHNDWRGMGLSMGWLGTPPFQVEANLGFSSAVLEMLAVSTPVSLRLLPGLPPSWPTGRAEGIGCRGALTLDLAWDTAAGTLSARIAGPAGREVSVGFPAPPSELSVQAGAPEPRPSDYGDRYRVVTLPADGTLELTAELAFGDPA